jgi:hypothetical protein
MLAGYVLLNQNEKVSVWHCIQKSSGAYGQVMEALTAATTCLGLC